MSKKSALLLLFIVLIESYSCKKDDDNDTPVTNPVTPQEVLTDFATFVVNPNYADIESKAQSLKTAIENLHANTNDQNLQLAQEAWRAVRVPWEQAEAYLFGPASDYNYDPATDSWPVNTSELDSLLV